MIGDEFAGLLNEFNYRRNPATARASPAISPMTRFTTTTSMVRIRAMPKSRI